MKDTSKFTEADIAYFDYHNNEFRSQYQEIMSLLANVEVLNRCITFCVNVPVPDDTSSPFYLDFAEKIQTYFINSQALYEMLTTTKGFKSEQRDVSDEFKAMVTFAKVIRNKVAHEGVWIPNSTRGLVKDKGAYEFFALPKTKLKELIFEATIRDKKQAVHKFNLGSLKFESCNHKLPELDKQLIDLIKKSNEWTEKALKYLDAHYSDQFDVHNFMLCHYQLFIPWVVNHFKRRAKEKNAKQVSELRRKIDLYTLDDKIEVCNRLYQEQITKLKVEHKS